MGYSEEQIHDLVNTINSVVCDLVLFATRIHLTQILSINKEAIRVRYEYKDHNPPFLEEILFDRFKTKFSL